MRQDDRKTSRGECSARPAGKGRCLGTLMNPGDVVPLSFNGGLVALSFLTAVLGSYVALLAAVGIRTETQDGDIRLGYILIGAVAMGGVGIWSMHFIGMQARTCRSWSVTRWV